LERGEDITDLVKEYGTEEDKKKYLTESLVEEEEEAIGDHKGKEKETERGQEAINSNFQKGEEKKEQEEHKEEGEHKEEEEDPENGKEVAERDDHKDTNQIPSDLEENNNNQTGENKEEKPEEQTKQETDDTEKENSTPNTEQAKEQLDKFEGPAEEEKGEEEGDEDAIGLSAELAKQNQDEKKKKKKKIPMIKTVATKQYTISKQPPYLTLHFKRFMQTFKGLQKIGKAVKFPHILDLQPFVNSKTNNNDDSGSSSEKSKEKRYKYRLYGVVNHSGSMRGGHYVTHVCTVRSADGDPEKGEEK